MKTTKTDLVEVADVSTGNEIDLTNGVISLDSVSTEKFYIPYRDITTLRVIEPVAWATPRYNFDFTAYVPTDDQVFIFEAQFKDPSHELIHLEVTNGNLASGTLLDAEGVMDALAESINEYSRNVVAPYAGGSDQTYNIHSVVTGGPPVDTLEVQIKKYWDPNQQKVGGPNPLADNPSDRYSYPNPGIEQYDCEISLTDTNGGGYFTVNVDTAIADPLGTSEIMTYYCNKHGVTPGALPGADPYDTIEIIWKEWIPGANGHRAYKEKRYLCFADAGGSLAGTVNNITSATGYTLIDYVGV